MGGTAWCCDNTQYLHSPSWCLCYQWSHSTTGERRGPQGRSCGVMLWRVTRALSGTWKTKIHAWHIYGGLRTTCKSWFLSFYPLGSRDKTWVVLLGGKLLHLLSHLTILLVRFWPKITLIALFNCSCCGREVASLLKSAHQWPNCWLYCSTCTIASLGLNFKKLPWEYSHENF